MNSPPRAAQRLFELGTCCSISERSGAGPATRAAALAARRGARPRADEPDGVRLRRLRRAVSANAGRRHARRLARRASQRGAARHGTARKRRNARGRSVHRIGEIPPIDASGTGSECTACRAPALQCAAAQLAGTLRRVVTRRAAAPACPVFRRSTPRRRPKRSRSTVAPLSGKPAHRGHHFVLFKKCINQNYPPNHFHSCIAGLSLCKKHPLNNQTPFIKCNNQSDTHYFQNQVHDQIHPF